MNKTFRLNKCKKNFISALYNCNNQREIIELMRVTYPHLDENYFIDVLLETQIFRFGSDIPNQMFEKYKTIMPNRALKHWFKDIDFVTLTKNDFRTIIDSYRQIIANEYKQLSENKSDEISQFIKKRFDRWNNPDNTIYGLSPMVSMTKSSDYEHQIWALIEIYRNFDWSTYDLILTRWETP